MVSQISTMCSVIVKDVQLSFPGILLCLGLYGFNGLPASFVPVELIGEIFFVRLKPCQNYKKF